MALPAFRNVAPIRFKFEIEKYLTECAENNEIPVFTALSVICGVHRSTVWRYIHGDFTDEEGHIRPYQSILKRAADYIEHQYDRAMTQGRGNIAGLIWSSKNNFGWKEPDTNVNVKGQVQVIVADSTSAITGEHRVIKSAERKTRVIDQTTPRIEPRRKAMVKRKDKGKGNGDGA